MPGKYRTASDIRDDYMLIAATRAAERRAAHRQQQVRAARNLLSRPAIVVPRAGYTTVARTRGVYGQGEMKYFDTERSVTAIPASVDWTGTEFPPNVGTPTTLCVPTVGSAINQRIGREVKLYKLKIRGVLSADPQTDQTAADAASLIRLLLVQDKQTNATQAQGEQIMAAPTSADAKMAISSFQSLANFGRFNVWKDKMFKLENPNASYDGTNVEVMGLQRNFKFTITFKKPISIRFNATNGGTIADIVDNSFCLYAMTTNTSLTPRITYYSRACYKE